MENKKYLVVNCTMCDARSVRESTLAAYEKIVINASAVLTSPRSRELLDQYPVVLNAANTIDAEEDAQVSTVNGKAEIKPGQSVPSGKVMLIVNGSLDIAPGSEELLKNYVGIQVNGSITCPESIAGLLPMATVNGTISTYPDGCVRLKRTAVLDRTFHLRARQDARYYAARRIVALASDIDFAKLAEKHVQFVTRELLVAEGLAETAIPLFDEQAEIMILPDGCAFVNDDAVLDESLVRRCGGKLYISGDLTVNRDSAPWLEQISFLRVSGDLLVTREMENAVRALDAEYGAMRIVAGALVSGRISVTVDRRMLEQATDGLSLADCVNVKFHKDVPPELIRQRLWSLTGCVNVSCTEEQRSAIELVAEDVVSIGNSGGGALEPAGKLLGQLGAMLCGKAPQDMSLADKAQLLMNTKVVNAASYTL